MFSSWYSILSPKVKILTGLIIAASLAVTLVTSVLADPVEEIQTEINQLSKQLKMSQDATAPLEGTLINLDNHIKSIQNQIANLQTQAGKEARAIDALEKNILKREVDLQVQRELLAVRVRNLYKRQRENSLITLLFSAQNAASLTRQLILGQSATRQDRTVIAQVSSQLQRLTNDKTEANQRKQKYEADQIKLKSFQVSIDQKAEFFRTEIAKAKDYQNKLTGQIAELTAKQQAILAEKTGTFQTTVGEIPLSSSDPASRPDYNPGFSPAFAAFSFGAPHYKGMSQYGAFGRAKSGQNYETILQAYYGNIKLETVDTNFNIPTTVGSLPFEDNYLKGIAEMPTRWADEGGYEALKAQAIAARSYALAYTGWRMGDRSVKKSICITESCQVYHAAKAASSGRWGDAVNDTKGVILVGDDSTEVVNAWYASTSGGYQESYTSLGHTTPGFWDTPSGRDGWTSQAYEKDSPWFYKGWYKSRSGDACGRSHPWLTTTEMADILNAWVVLIKHGQSDDRVTPLGGCWGGNPYSIEELRNKAASLGQSYSSVSNISAVNYATNGITANLTFQTNSGSLTLPGAEFKKAFNLRAPARVAIKSGLFNIEKK